MCCVESVSYSVVLNGEVGEQFHPSRGLRQGDPFSPYLFLVYSEGLSAVLRMASKQGRLKGARVNRYAPLITHLLFADDSLISGEAIAAGAMVLKEILETYASSSGQLVIFD